MLKVDCYEALFGLIYRGSFFGFHSFFPFFSWFCGHVFILLIIHSFSTSGSLIEVTKFKTHNYLALLAAPFSLLPNGFPSLCPISSFANFPKSL